MGMPGWGNTLVGIPGRNNPVLLELHNLYCILQISHGPLHIALNIVSFPEGFWPDRTSLSCQSATCILAELTIGLTEHEAYGLLKRLYTIVLNAIVIM